MLRRGFRMVALMGAILMLSAATAWAAPKATVKPYSLAVTQPSAGVPVGTTANFSVTLTNGADPQSLGSANISIPEFRLGDVTSGTASVVANTLQLRNLNLLPHASVTVAFTATASCRAGTYTWNVAVKQSNDFNGPPGNDFTPATSAPQTTITGSCDLEFLAQPADASGPGVVITSVPLSTTGTAVSVRVVDNEGNPTSVSGVPITLSLGLNGGGATGFGVTQPTSSGVASFPGISLNRYGLYQFDATSPGLTTAASSLFNVWQQTADCATSCALTSSENGFSATLTSGGGTGNLGVSLGGRTKPVCGPGGIYDTEFNHAPNTVTGNAYGAAATSEKIVTLVVEKKVDQREPNNGVSFYQVCYAAPVANAPDAAIVRSGTTANQDPTTGEWVWVLPDCSPHVPSDAACVLSRNKDNAGRVFIVFRLAAGDPTWW